ncbi:hypothetical protein JAAARDRAFT_206635 [Jaapia argillacea MUCL 33604]|uniref:Prolyl 4-hydroxylase alpha subunit Fe(2+) 2OG dioxygenase domain-containing protein n=1 Tax=Jaapia argillacea MUCL 33604 TaxID=933084 RepID=A0A067PY38_9AGAM|nr:hypothetical protein JAAARDRAFT_206635 [Jaapia argillacea MUCL 33604]
MSSQPQVTIGSRRPLDCSSPLVDYAEQQTGVEAKRGRFEDQVIPITASLLSVPSLRSAIDVRNAIEGIECVQPIGSCPAELKAILKLSDRMNEDEDEEDKGEEDDDFKEVTNVNQNAVKQISPIYRQMFRTHAQGRFDFEFSLTVTQPGCEFNGKLKTGSDCTHLEELFEHAPSSGYGDVVSQETKVDSDVRDAREITADGFSVDTILLEAIQKCWGEHFYPNAVRAEPYKIHLYGPDGHFREHRDTPQKDLVGTFLLGIGDTTGGWGNLQVGEENVRADVGSWCAFYPDVVHSVSRILNGHRGVIAFKMFRTGPNATQDILPPEFRAAFQQAVDKFQAPVGICLDRKYCLGTTQLSGVDGFLLECFRQRVEAGEVTVHVLPIVVKSHAEWISEDDGWDDFSVKVYPFTEFHIDFILGRDDDLKAKNREWLGEVKDVSFYSMDMSQTTVTWSFQKSEGADYTGNEALPFKGDSVYLAYALLVLPKDAT